MRPHETPRVFSTARTGVELFGHGSPKRSPKRLAYRKQALEEAPFPCNVPSPIPHFSYCGFPLKYSMCWRFTVGGGTGSYKDPLTLSDKPTSDSSGLKVTHGRKGKVRLWVMLMVCPRMLYTNRVKVRLYV